MRALYMRLPEACRHRPLLVREPSDWGVARRRAAYGYDPEGDCCEIHLRRGLWRFPADWAHELGHLADHWAVSAAEQEAWRREWQQICGS